MREAAAALSVLATSTTLRSCGVLGARVAVRPSPLLSASSDADVFAPVAFSNREQLLCGTVVGLSQGGTLARVQYDGGGPALPALLALGSPSPGAAAEGEAAGGSALLPAHSPLAEALFSGLFADGDPGTPLLHAGSGQAAAQVGAADFAALASVLTAASPAAGALTAGSLPASAGFRALADAEDVPVALLSPVDSYPCPPVLGPTAPMLHVAAAADSASDAKAESAVAASYRLLAATLVLALQPAAAIRRLGRKAAGWGTDALRSAAQPGLSGSRRQASGGASPAPGGGRGPLPLSAAQSLSLGFARSSSLTSISSQSSMGGGNGAGDGASARGAASPVPAAPGSSGPEAGSEAATPLPDLSALAARATVLRGMALCALEGTALRNPRAGPAIARAGLLPALLDAALHSVRLPTFIAPARLRERCRIVAHALATHSLFASRSAAAGDDGSLRSIAAVALASAVPLLQLAGAATAEHGHGRPAGWPRYRLQRRQPRTTSQAGEAPAASDDDTASLQGSDSGSSSGGESPVASSGLRGEVPAAAATRRGGGAGAARGGEPSPRTLARQEAARTLVAMGFGFDAEACASALRRCGDDLNRAAEWLMTPEARRVLSEEASSRAAAAAAAASAAGSAGTGAAGGSHVASFPAGAGGIAVAAPTPAAAAAASGIGGRPGATVTAEAARWRKAADLAEIWGMPASICFQALLMHGEDPNASMSWLMDRGALYVEALFEEEASGIAAVAEAEAEEHARRQEALSDAAALEGVTPGEAGGGGGSSAGTGLAAGAGAAAGLLGFDAQAGWGSAAAGARGLGTLAAAQPAAGSASAASSTASSLRVRDEDLSGAGVYTALQLSQHRQAVGVPEVTLGALPAEAGGAVGAATPSRGGAGEQLGPRQQCYATYYAGDVEGVEGAPLRLGAADVACCVTGVRLTAAGEGASSAPLALALMGTTRFGGAVACYRAVEMDRLRAVTHVLGRPLLPLRSEEAASEEEEDDEASASIPGSLPGPQRTLWRMLALTWHHLSCHAARRLAGGLLSAWLEAAPFSPEGAAAGMGGVAAFASPAGAAPGTALLGWESGPGAAGVPAPGTAHSSPHWASAAGAAAALQAAALQWPPCPSIASLGPAGGERLIHLTKLVTASSAAFARGNSAAGSAEGSGDGSSGASESSDDAAAAGGAGAGAGGAGSGGPGSEGAGAGAFEPSVIRFDEAPTGPGAAAGGAVAASRVSAGVAARAGGAGSGGEGIGAALLSALRLLPSGCRVLTRAASLAAGAAAPASAAAALAVLAASTAVQTVTVVAGTPAAGAATGIGAGSAAASSGRGGGGGGRQGGLASAASPAAAGAGGGRAELPASSLSPGLMGLAGGGLARGGHGSRPSQLQGARGRLGSGSGAAGLGFGTSPLLGGLAVPGPSLSRSPLLGGLSGQSNGLGPNPLHPQHRQQQQQLHSRSPGSHALVASSGGALPPFALASSTSPSATAGAFSLTPTASGPGTAGAGRLSPHAGAAAASAVPALAHPRSAWVWLAEAVLGQERAGQVAAALAPVNGPAGVLLELVRGCLVRLLVNEVKAKQAAMARYALRRTRAQQQQHQYAAGAAAGEAPVRTPGLGAVQAPTPDRPAGTTSALGAGFGSSVPRSASGASLVSLSVGQMQPTAVEAGVAASSALGTTRPPSVSSMLGLGRLASAGSRDAASGASSPLAGGPGGGAAGGGGGPTAGTASPSLQKAASRNAAAAVIAAAAANRAAAGGTAAASSAVSSLQRAVGPGSPLLPAAPAPAPVAAAASLAVASELPETSRGGAGVGEGEEHRGLSPDLSLRGTPTPLPPSRTPSAAHTPVPSWADVGAGGGAGLDSPAPPSPLVAPLSTPALASLASLSLGTAPISASSLAASLLGIGGGLGAGSGFEAATPAFGPAASAAAAGGLRQPSGGVGAASQLQAEHGGGLPPDLLLDEGSHAPVSAGVLDSAAGSGLTAPLQHPSASHLPPSGPSFPSLPAAGLLAEASHFPSPSAAGAGPDGLLPLPGLRRAVSAASSPAAPPAPRLAQLLLEQCVSHLIATTAQRSAPVSSAAASVLSGLDAAEAASAAGGGGGGPEGRQMIESLHPYFHRCEYAGEVVSEGAKALRVSFDPRSELAREGSTLTFYADRGLSQPLASYPVRSSATQQGGSSAQPSLRGPPAFPPFVVHSDRVYYRFSSAKREDANHGWGYRAYVAPMRGLQWRSERQVAAEPSLEWACWLLEFLLREAAEHSVELFAAVHTRSIFEALVGYLRTPGAPFKARIVLLLTELLLNPAAFLAAAGSGGAAAGSGREGGSARDETAAAASSPLSGVPDLTHLLGVADLALQRALRERALGRVFLPPSLLRLVELAAAAFAAERFFDFQRTAWQQQQQQQQQLAQGSGAAADAPAAAPLLRSTSSALSAQQQPMLRITGPGYAAVGFAPAFVRVRADVQPLLAGLGSPGFLASAGPAPLSPHLHTSPLLLHASPQLHPHAVPRPSRASGGGGGPPVLAAGAAVTTWTVRPSPGLAGQTGPLQPSGSPAAPGGTHLRAPSGFSPTLSAGSGPSGLPRGPSQYAQRTQAQQLLQVGPYTVGVALRVEPPIAPGLPPCGDEATLKDTLLELADLAAVLASAPSQAAVEAALGGEVGAVLDVPAWLPTVVHALARATGGAHSRTRLGSDVSPSPQLRQSGGAGSGGGSGGPVARGRAGSSHAHGGSPHLASTFGGGGGGGGGASPSFSSPSSGAHRRPGTPARSAPHSSPSGMTRRGSSGGLPGLPLLPSTSNDGPAPLMLSPPATAPAAAPSVRRASASGPQQPAALPLSTAAALRLPDALLCRAWLDACARVVVLQSCHPLRYSELRAGWA
jgi:hypothetical protein